MDSHSQSRKEIMLNGENEAVVAKVLKWPANVGECIAYSMLMRIAESTV